MRYSAVWMYVVYVSMYESFVLFFMVLQSAV